MSRRALCRMATFAAIALFGPLLSWLARAAGPTFDYQLQARSVATGVYAFIGKAEDFSTVNGGNIVNTGFIVSADGILIIDSGPSRRYGEQMRAVIGRISPLPLRQLFNTHHHPDHFLGNQAFTDVPLRALDSTRQGIVSEGNAFAENLYRMSGNWMQDTEVQAPSSLKETGRILIAGRPLRLLALHGHTAGDLAIYDEISGVLFAGDLVFHQRAPTTPHAHIKHWLSSLDVLEAITREPGFHALVPGHGPITHDASAIRQTRAWLLWLEQSMREAAAAGLDMNDLMQRPLPAEFKDMALGQREYQRSLGHLFPQAEQEALGHGHAH